MNVPKSQDQILDANLLSSTAAGDVAAFEELYDRHSPIAYAVARRITSDPTLAEDVVQDAFLGVWRNAGRYLEARGSVRNWLLAIVHHRAIDSVRKRRLTIALPQPEAIVPPALTVADGWTEVAGRLDLAEIRAGLALLSPVQRQVIDLAYFGGLTQCEIAERTRIPLGTVKSRVRRGLVELRLFLEQPPRSSTSRG